MLRVLTGWVSYIRRDRRFREVVIWTLSIVLRGRLRLCWRFIWARFVLACVRDWGGLFRFMHDLILRGVSRRILRIGVTCIVGGRCVSRLSGRRIDMNQLEWLSRIM